MTILLYSGTPGSGKSLHATRDIRDHLKWRKLPVLANYEVVVDESWKGNFTYVPNNELRPDSLVLWAVNWWSDGKPFKEDSILLVIDECQLLFNSRSWADADRMSWIEFFSQHRKFGYKIIFIAQFDLMIDKQIRSVIEYEVNHRKFANFGLFGKVLSIPFGQLFIAVKRYYMMSARLGAEWFRFSKKLSKMYNSYTAFEQQGQGTAALRSGADVDVNTVKCASMEPV